MSGENGWIVLLRETREIKEGWMTEGWMTEGWTVCGEENGEEGGGRRREEEEKGSERKDPLGLERRKWRCV